MYLKGKTQPYFHQYDTFDADSDGRRSRVRFDIVYILSAKCAGLL